MATEVKLPALGESVTEGTVTQWLKSVGDDVAVDEALLEVSTDKVDTEIPSPVAGTLLEIRADEDETVEVGAVLAVIGEEGESADEAATPEVDAGSDQASSDGPPETQQGSAESDDGGQDTDDAGQDTDDAEPGDDASDASESASETDDETDEDESEDTSQAPAAEADDSGQDNTGSTQSGGGDSTDVTLPALGESVTEGTVTQWLKSVGDDVAVDEALLEVSTDKVDTEIPSPVAGTLLEIVVGEDETVEVGAVLARVGSEGAAGSQESSSDGKQTGAGEQQEKAEAEPEPEPKAAEADEEKAEPEQEEPAEPEQEKQAEPTQREQATKPTSSTDDTSSAEGRSYVTPLVRKLAAKHGVDLGSLAGTGVGGRVRKQDVLAAADEAERAAAEQEKKPEPETAPAASTADSGATQAPPAPSPLRGKTEKLSRLRKVIASRMLESLQTSAQLTTVVEVDVTAISRLRNRVKAGFEQREGVKLSFLPFFAKAAIDALKTYPQVNASINTDEGTVTYHDGEHLGVAVDTERGLLVPVIKNAGDLSIAGIARKIQDLAARTREGQVSPDELSGGTFTLTNTGSRGALFDTPIINQPQVAILGTGTVVKRPVVIDDPNLGETIAVRQMVYLALTYDHRLVDGADAARFLMAIKQRLEEANFESELGV
ncbi:MAG: hypothetical protein QOI06_3132 [Nocardioidaceae bacterium]|jgi:pyruvate dehydrogenase E2 component (dihydrolipoamide acetyltransferase)|nr:hypothetical protein [Nocardioidaceae bacterium]